LGYNGGKIPFTKVAMMKPSNPAERHVVVLGASAKPLRYSNQAIRLLQEKGYPITPVHPRLETIEGIAVASSLQSVAQPVDTLTLYLGPQRLEPLIDQVIAGENRHRPGCIRLRAEGTQRGVFRAFIISSRIELSFSRIEFNSCWRLL